MEDFDHRPAYEGEAFIPSQIDQKAENAKNWNDNCMPTSAMDALTAVGIGLSGKPQDWTNFEYGASYHGGETWPAVIDYIHKKIAPSLSISLSNPMHILPGICAAGAKGFPSVPLFWSDSGANLKPYVTGILHAAPVVAHLGGKTLIKNPWTQKIETYSDDTFDKATSTPGAYAGWTMTINKAVLTTAPPSPPSPPKPPPPPPGGVVWKSERHTVGGITSRVRSSYSFGSSTLRILKGGTAISTDGFIDTASGRWYHLSKASGYGWMHQSVVR